MGICNPFDSASLKAQIHRQKKYAWTMDQLPWEWGVDLTKPFLPLDDYAIAFPGASHEQKLAISQLMGLIVNSTIGELELVINRLRTIGWADILKTYPVNPEMGELGELFFEEENKHAEAFTRYNRAFCSATGIAPDDLDLLLPKAFGATFLKTIVANAKKGGHAFWWVVASVEEVSILLYRQIAREKERIDPLYFQVHFRHMEEESRHHNYAFLMLDLVERRGPSISRLLHKKFDLLLAQGLTTAWVLSEIHKVYDAQKLAHRHEFFRVIASSLPLIRQLKPWELIQRLFVSAPYISLMMNTKNHPLTTKMASQHGAISFPFPQPQEVPIEADFAKTTEKKLKFVS